MIRFFDIIFSITALIFFAPIFLIIIIILKVTGEGEIFYFQKRVGLDAKEFRLFKFATMIKNSENIGSGTITIDNDFRVLPFGKFLRKTKINELPQLFNVLKGDLCLIGPRPQTINSFENYDNNDKYKINSVRPGLSGISAIIFRDEENILSQVYDPISFDKSILMPYKGKLECWFVENLSITLYFKLIFITIYVVIFSKYYITYFICVIFPIY